MNKEDVAMENNEVLKTKEAVKFLKTTEKTLFKMVHEGKLKGNKVGNSYRFLKRDLEEYISQKESKN
jgi:excisionase family DNA binding protein